MIVKKYQPNPLNTFNLRRLDYCPPHFFAINFNIVTNEKKISDWIWYNLQGRFYLGDNFVIINDLEHKRSQIQKSAAFEIHSESSYFAMLLPELNKF